MDDRGDVGRLLDEMDDVITGWEGSRDSARWRPDGESPELLDELAAGSVRFADIDFEQFSRVLREASWCISAFEELPARARDFQEQVAQLTTHAGTSQTEMHELGQRVLRVYGVLPEELGAGLKVSRWYRLRIRISRWAAALSETVADLWWAAYYFLRSLRARVAIGRRWWLLRRCLRGPGPQSTISVFRRGDFEHLPFGAAIEIGHGSRKDRVRVVGVEVAGDIITFTVEAA